MFPLGHVSFAYVAFAVVDRVRFDRRPSRETTLVLVFSSLLPDLIDKPLAWYLGVLPSGRSLGHSLLTAVSVSLLVVLLARRYGQERNGIAFALGIVSHCVLDALPSLWDPTNCAGFLLWPLVSHGDCIDASIGLLSPFVRSLWVVYALSEGVLAAIAVILWRTGGSPGLEPR